MSHRTCSQEGCERRCHANGLCVGHISQLKSGKELRPITPRRSNNFDESYTKDESGCWLWQEAIYEGYAYIRVGGKSTPAHRLSFQRYKGGLSEDQIVDHMCRVKHCVNPDHLQIATRKTNGENLGLSKVNSSGFRGVHWDPINRKWCATVKHNYRKHWGGRFENIQDAQAAVVELRNRLHTNNLEDRGLSPIELVTV